MSLKNYIKDKSFVILLYILIIIIISFILICMSLNIEIIIMINVVLIIFFTVILLYDYYIRKKFYDELLNNFDNLDKKYLITEMIKEPSFIDGKILLSMLYDIDKVTLENINYYKCNNEEFREYLDIWCHEIKTPIATSKLIIENNSNKITNSILEEVNKINNCVEQVLFYSRSGIVEKDYIIKRINIENIIKDVISRNKKSLIEKNIKIKLNNINVEVNTDSKWISFILNQIISNSIKYAKGKEDIIEINCIVNKNNVNLIIKDSGIGIKEDELIRVFDKGFTGTNGRMKYNSTGFGLYICQKLCLKLGINIIIDSKLNEYTKVILTFPNSSLSNLTDL